MSRLSFNRSPYYDDYQSTKNYMKVLFRPGRPVQTRELNQIQSIFQNQVEKFANHIFKNGSRISNARASYNAREYVRLEDISPWTSSAVDVVYLPSGTILTGQTSNVTGTLIKSVAKEGDDPPTIYVMYTGMGIDGETARFIPGEVVSVYDVNGIPYYSVKVRCPGCAGSTLEDTIAVLGKGTIFNIDEGVFYFEGMFIESSRQDIIVSKYGEPQNLKIGFDFIQEIITSDDDSSLLDNALGYPNASAPGADRYKTSLVLTKRSLSTADGDNFILLALVEKGKYRYLKADSEYADIMDMIAKRTFETNGNFTVVPFKVRFMEDLANDVLDDTGYSVDGDPDYVRTVVMGGISYVLGYRFENTGELFIKTKKARDTRKTASFIKRFEERTSINLIPLKSYSSYPNKADDSPVMDDTVINIYDGPFDGGNNPTGNIIGTFKVYDVNYVSGIVNSTVTPAVFKYFIFDLVMVSGKKLTDAKCFADSTGTRGFKALPENANVTLYNPGKTELIWRLQKDNIKTLRSIADSGDPNPPGSIQIFLRKKLIGILNSSGSVTFNSATNEFFEEYDPVRTVAVIIDTDQGAGISRAVNIAGKTSITTTTFTLNLGTTLDIGTGTNLNTPGCTICIIHNVMRVNAQENFKTYQFVQNDMYQPIMMVNNLIPLGICDAFSIDYVIAFDMTNINDPGTDITDQFTLQVNTTETTYNESKLQFTGTLPGNANIRWKYRVNYFEHNTASNLGYFDVDSYRQLISSGVIGYEDNPTFVASNKSEYPLFGSFDFRPLSLSGEVTGETVPVIGSTAVFDIEYYQPRTDLLCVNKDGLVYTKSGEPSDTPRPPRIDDDAMALYEIYFKPYTYSINDISVKYIENKRYTMRDIGKIEERIKIVEYYTALSLLEKSAQDMSIKDQNGLDRFKNGFIADNFKDYQAADLTSSDFRAALDRKGRELRPSFTPRNKNLVPVRDESDCRFIGTLAMIDFDSVLVSEQPYATKHISVNPMFQFKLKGEMVLLPNMDVWSDTTRLPELTVNVDTGVEEIRKLATAAGVLGTQWGSWVDLNSTSQSASSSSTVPADQWGGTSTTTTTTTTTTTNQTRSGTNTTMDTKTTAYDMGDRVTDVSINPWMRATDITFLATKMAGNTKIYPFFDGKPVGQYVRTLKGAPGEQLITDEFGQIGGVFSCPGGVFHTGDRKFYLTTDKDLTGDPDLEWTAAEAIYFSGGLNVTKQHTTMNVITPVFNQTQVTDNRTVTSTSTSSSTTTIPGTPPPPPPPPPTGGCDQNDTVGLDAGDCARWNPTTQSCQPRCICCGHCSGCYEPVAQGFKLDHDCFITGLDIYFYVVDTTSDDEIFFQIRTMVNGYPSSDEILADKRFLTAEIDPFCSEDSKTPFHVDFDFPIYTKAGTTYCFVVGGYSPSSRMWVARLGQTIVDQPGKIVEQQPSMESSFRSQNAETWNAEQFEDVKYRLYGAQFKKTSMSIRFRHEDELTPLDRDPFEAEEGKSKVRVYAMDHGLLAGDKVSIHLYEDNWVWIDVLEGQMQIGMIIRNESNTFTGKVIDYKTDQSKSYIKIGSMVGAYSANEGFVCDQMDKSLHDNYLITKIGYSATNIQNDGTVRFNRVAGTFKEGVPLAAVFNGFTFASLSRQHTVVEVDSMDTFIIQIAGGTATESGRFGGEASTISINEKYELFNVSGAYLTYGSAENWAYTGIGHNPPNGPFVDKEEVPDKSVIIGNDMYLGRPHKVISSDNVNDVGDRIMVQGVFSTPGTWLSPVINTDSFSITTVSNRVEWTTLNQMNVEPNSTNRFKSESDPMNGSENYKYVTKTISLKNPASDLVIAFDVYKDINADFDIWIKVTAPYEDVDIDTKRWMRVSGLDKTYHSVDLIDRVEYELTLSELTLDVFSNDTTFVNNDWGDVVEEFNAFKVKIVGRAKNPALPPLFQSFRCIAVT